MGSHILDMTYWLFMMSSISGIDLLLSEEVTIEFTSG
jgi:hypothetical protein